MSTTPVVDERKALRKALAAAKSGHHPIAAILLKQANKGLKRGWSPQIVRRILAEVTKLVATAGDPRGGVSVPDSPRAKREERQRLKVARKARPGRKPTPQDKPWDAIEGKQVAKEGKAKAVFAELSTLPPHQRNVVRGRLVKGKTLRETAMALGISEDQASRRYKAGIERLRKQTDVAAVAVPADELMVSADDCGRRLLEVEDEESFEETYGPDNQLIIVKRPNNSWLSTRSADATPVFERDRKSTKLNWLGNQ